MRIFGLAAILCSVLFTPAVDGYSQEPIDSVLARLGRYTHIRVEVKEGHTYEERLVRVERNPLAVRLVSPPDPIPASSIDRLWIGETATQKGAWIGAGSLAGLTLAVFGGGCFAVDGCDKGTFALGVLASAAIGGLVGALVGNSTVTEWIQVYPSGAEHSCLGCRTWVRYPLAPFE